MSMTHKEWMRRCIEECKTCGNLNTASGAERLIEKFAERMDETNGQLSEGKPYQQYVTDGEGKAKWEDRLAYKTKVFDDIVWDGIIEGHETAEPFPQVTIVKVSDIPLSAENVVGATIVYGDELRRVEVTQSVIESIDDSFWIFEMIVLMPEDGKFFSASLTSGVWFFADSKAREFLSPEAAHPIPAEYLPTNVPVVQKAYPGQLIAVKTVDDDGRPTAWEAAMPFCFDLVNDNTVEPSSLSMEERMKLEDNMISGLGAVLSDDVNGHIMRFNQLSTPGNGTMVLTFGGDYNKAHIIIDTDTGTVMYQPEVG